MKGKKHQRNRLALAAAAFSLGVLVLFAGCSGNAPMAPTQPDLPQFTALGFLDVNLSNQDDQDDGLLSLNLEILNVGELSSQVFGLLGGVLEIARGDADASSSLQVYPFSIRGIVRITARAYEVDWKGENATVYDFGPDGLVFKHAAVLTHSTHKADGEVCELFWFNERRGEWELEDSARVSNGQVQFKIKHFSKYGIS